MVRVRYTEAPARRAELLHRLEADGYIASAQIAAEFGVSEMTIRRDLHQLHVEGRARRVVGGAALTSARGAPFDERARARGEEKRAIALACAAEIRGADTIALDAGTTVAELADLLGSDTTVVTHSVPLISACAARGDIRLMGIGGEYQADTMAFTGSVARAGLDGFAVDVAVLSATAVHGAWVLSANALDAEMKRSMAAIATRTVLLVDSSKLSARAPIRVLALSSVHTLITGIGADPSTVERIRATGVRVVVADADAADDATIEDGAAG